MSNSLIGYVSAVTAALAMILPHSSVAEHELTNGLIKEDFASLRYSFPVAQDWSFENFLVPCFMPRKLALTR